MILSAGGFFVVVGSLCEISLWGKGGAEGERLRG